MIIEANFIDIADGQHYLVGAIGANDSADGENCRFPGTALTNK